MREILRILLILCVAEAAAGAVQDRGQQKCLAGFDEGRGPFRVASTA